MSVVTLTFYEYDDPPDGGTPVGTLTDADLEHFAMRKVLSTKGIHTAEVIVNRHDAAAALLVQGRWMTVDIPVLKDDGPILAVRLGPRFDTVLSEDEESGEVVQIGGLGVLSQLTHARLLEDIYAPGQPSRGSTPSLPGEWSWREGAGIAYGGIMVRGIEEGQEQPGAPLEHITITFDREDNSAGIAWPHITDEFRQPIGVDVGELHARLAEGGRLFLVEHPDLSIDGFSAYGQGTFGVDRTTASFATGKVLFTVDPDVVSNLLTGLEEEGEDEPYTHVIVEGANGVYVTRTSPAYSSGPGKWGFVSYNDSDDTTLLEDVGDEFLARSSERTHAREFEIAPGDDEDNGLYLPVKHFNEGDLASLAAGGIQEDVRIVAWRLELASATSDATTEDEARSLHIVVETDAVNSAESDQPGGSGSGGPGPALQSPRLCGPAIEGSEGSVTELYHLHWADGLQETVAIHPSGTDVWPGNSVRVVDGDSSAGSIAHDADSGYVDFKLSDTQDGSPLLPATAGTTYRFEFDTRYAGGIDIRFENSGSIVEQTRIATHVEGGSWVARSVELTAPIGTDSMQWVPISAGHYAHVRISSVTAGTETQNPNAGTSPKAARCDHTHDTEEHDHDADYAPVEHYHAINEATDVDVSTLPTDGQVLAWDDATETWIPATPSGGGALDDLTDVTITTPSDGQVLTYDSGTGEWVNENSASGFSNPMTTAGDIIIGDTGGAAIRLPIGSAGQVLTVSSGAPAWAAPSGGGGALGIWLPDAPPTSAGSEDDEFADASGGVPSGWTEYDPQAHTTVTEDEAGLKLTQATDAGSDWAGIYKAIPAGDFTIWTKLGLTARKVGEAGGGLVLWEDATDTTKGFYVAGLVYDNTGTFTRVSRWTNATTWNTNTSSISIGQGHSHMYCRIRRTGTTYAFDFSTDGTGWYQQLSSTIAFTPTHFGVGVNNVAQGNDVIARYPFFRYVSSDLGIGGLSEGDRV